MRNRLKLKYYMSICTRYREHTFAMQPYRVVHEGARLSSFSVSTRCGKNLYFILSWPVLSLLLALGLLKPSYPYKVFSLCLLTIKVAEDIQA
jgi:hypothetical protein